MEEPNFNLPDPTVVISDISKSNYLSFNVQVDLAISECQCR